MLQTPAQSRREFLNRTLGQLTACGLGICFAPNLFADGTQLAARLKEAPASHPLSPAFRMGKEALDALEPVRDYTATLFKQERIRGKLLSSKMQLKFRESPFSVYLKFLQPNAGREVIYVAGQNQGKLLVHETGFAALAGTLALDPTGSMALAENRHPITSIGMRNLANKLLEQWLNETEINGVSVNYYPNAKIENLACRAVESKYPAQQPGILFHMTRMYLNAETGHPIRVQQYGFPATKGGEPVLMEDYLYSNIRLNVGLTDRDFSSKNPEYGF